MTSDRVRALTAALRGRTSVFVLTGAGCSTGSGIPDYRDCEGRWKRVPPVQWRDFLTHPVARQRYWARSMAGWPSFSAARPGPAHRALVRLEEAGHVRSLVTQNVDGLHQRAGSTGVIDLHGRNDRVVCIECGHDHDRDRFQGELNRLNPHLRAASAPLAPDGDANLPDAALGDFLVPGCGRCGGVVRPDVVFFGDAVPRARVAEAYRRLAQSDAVLTVGTSLMVYSGFRFCRAALEQGKPVWVINQGRTRADDLASIKVSAECGRVLRRLVEGLAREGRA